MVQRTKLAILSSFGALLGSKRASVCRSRSPLLTSIMSHHAKSRPTVLYHALTTTAAHCRNALSQRSATEP